MKKNKRNSRQGINVIQDKESEVPFEVMAKAIKDMSDAMRALSNSRLDRSAVIALIKDRSGLTKGTIEIVLNNLEELERIWLKPVRK